MSLPLYHNKGEGNKKRLLPYKIPKSVDLFDKHCCTGFISR